MWNPRRVKKRTRLKEEGIRIPHSEDRTLTIMLFPETMIPMRSAYSKWPSLGNLFNKQTMISVMKKAEMSRFQKKTGIVGITKTTPCVISLKSLPD